MKLRTAAINMNLVECEHREGLLNIDECFMDGMNRNNNLVATILIIVIFTCGVSVVLLDVALSYSPSTTELDNLNIMMNLNSNATKTALRNMFDRNYNFTELYQWEHTKLKFVNNETFERSSDPLRILQVGKGKCGEFSVLYVALCLAHGYQSRLVLAIDVHYRVFWLAQHEWAEVKIGDHWIHVDPSDQVWNQPSHYKTWPWAKGVGSNVWIYAFEDGKVTDVTQYYKAAIGAH